MVHASQRDPFPIRKYRADECAVFYKTREQFGGLSNMAGGWPLRVQEVRVPSSEALYQACRFPDRPDVQELILAQSSPMSAKMVSKPYRDEEGRADWEDIRVEVMAWCLNVKLAQHWGRFSELLLSTGDRPIVERSRRDDFWGAKMPPDDSGTLVGRNVLGRLLEELRMKVIETPNTVRDSPLLPPSLADFYLPSPPKASKIHAPRFSSLPTTRNERPTLRLVGRR